MKKINLVILIAAIMAVINFNCQTAYATVHRVNNNTAYNQYSGPVVFNNLSVAISDASVLSGDTLYVEASGTSYGDITLMNKQLVIIGTGYFLGQNAGLQQNQVSSTVSSITFTTGSSGSTVMGLSVASGGAQNINLADVPLSNITITRCFIGANIRFQNSAGTVFNNIIISKNYLNAISEATALGTITGLYIANNYFGGSFGVGGANQFGTVTQNIFTLGGNLDIQAGINFYNNIFTSGFFAPHNNTSTNVYNNLFSIAQPAWLTGGNNNFNVPTSTIFQATGSTDGILHVNTSCLQCYQGFPGTVEEGIYGGSDPYVLSGIPSIPTIYLLQAPANVSQGAIDSTHVSTRSNN